MCGICGFLNYSGDTPEATIEEMCAALLHRGPDDGGRWLNAERSVALGHRRLSIIDLSPLGHQPMKSESGRFTITFNGEIYNFPELRASLEQSGARFRGASDTEVMLAGFEEWGVRTSLEKFAGMFAFAVWDDREQTLTLARDRLGEKPLYYGWCGKTFIFGSELKALRAFPGFKAELDHEALALYLKCSCVPSPYAIYKNIYKLSPGSFLEMPINGAGQGFSPHPDDRGARITPKRYWSAQATFDRFVQGETHQYDEGELLQELESLLTTSIRGQMIADVPLGAFLSGGIDSSLVVAIMQRIATSPVRTFSIGFHEPSFNEAEYAKAVATHLRADHTELYVTAADAQRVIPLLPTIYDEPFADSSQIPTYLVAKLARSQLTVSLSGDGGDELFCGYGRYRSSATAWKLSRLIPGPFRPLLARSIETIPVSLWRVLLGWASRAFPAQIAVRDPEEKIQALAHSLQARTPAAFYESLLAHWPFPERFVKGLYGQVAKHEWPRCADLMALFMFMDITAYLPDDLLVKVDRAAMANSLETRAPFLSHSLVEFALRLPTDFKLRGGKSKYLLRRLLSRYVPDALVERPKMGFGVPIDRWMRGELREWCESLLSENALHKRGLFDPKPIRKRWNEHLAGARSWAYPLWDVLMLQAWLEANERA